MRRLLSFIFDFLIVVFPISLVSTLIDKYTIIPTTIFLGIAIPFLYSLLEYKFKGITPGRYLFSLELTCKDGASLTFHRLLLRNIIFFLLFPLLIGILSIFSIYFGFYTIHLSTYIAIIILLPIALLSYTFTLGKQSYHDIPFKTLVKSKNEEKKGTFDIKHAMVILIISIFLSLIFVFIIERKTSEIGSKLDNTLFFEEHMNEDILFSIPPPSTIILNHNIENFFDYSADYQASNGYKLINLNEIDTPNINLDKTDIGKIAPSYSIYVTKKGIISHSFKQKLSINTLNYTSVFSENSAHYIDYIYIETFLGLVTVRIKHRMFAYHYIIHNKEIPYLVSLKDSYSLDISISSINALFQNLTLNEKIMSLGV